MPNIYTPPAIAFNQRCHFPGSGYAEITRGAVKLRKGILLELTDDS